MLKNLSHLPAATLVPNLLSALANSNVIVGAPPGAGKSTVLPLAVLQGMTKGKVLLMQPRRVVVRNLANYLATLCNEDVGQRVGYRIRGETKVSNNTQLEVITEGVLARMIQRDPELKGVDAIIFDEFHERSLHTDFGLALALEVQTGLREDLRLIVMSATLDLDPIAGLFNKHSVLPLTHLETEGKRFPVEVSYQRDVLPDSLAISTCNTVMLALEKHEGDVLVFLPGQRFIQEVKLNLSSKLDSGSVMIHTLFGALNKQAQQQAIEKDSLGRRKIILATNIAETSLTIDGIKVVVDSLWENQATYSLDTGFTQLSLRRISQASAIQRMGRAGRLSSGYCYRLCSADTFSRLDQYAKPQIAVSDLTSLVLDTLNWGAIPSELALLSMPSNAAINAGLDTLARIGAVNAQGQLTAYGRRLSTIPCHPCIAHMLLTAASMTNAIGKVSQKDIALAAPIVAALLEDSAISSEQVFVSDVLKNLNTYQRDALLNQAKRYSHFSGARLSSSALFDIEEDAIAVCLALAFPQRVGFQRSSNAKDAREVSYKLAGGKGASIRHPNPPTWVVVSHAQLGQQVVSIRCCQPIDEETVKQLYPQRFSHSDSLMYNEDKGALEARRVYSFDNITLDIQPISGVEKKGNMAYWENETANAWLRYLLALPHKQLPWNERDWRVVNRILLASSLQLPQHEAFDEPEPWPSSIDDLLNLSAPLLLPELAKCTHVKQLSNLSWSKLLQRALSWPQQSALTSLLPEQLITPSGKKVDLRYQSNGNVIASTRLQDLFGQWDRVTIANGKVTVLFELLSPARRPLQLTADLGAFWKGSYIEIQKEMKGRYPKHNWELPN